VQGVNGGGAATVALDLPIHPLTHSPGKDGPSFELTEGSSTVTVGAQCHCVATGSAAHTLAWKEQPPTPVQEAARGLTPSAFVSGVASVACGLT